MDLQISSRIKTWFSLLFECFTIRTKPKYNSVDEEDEILYLNNSTSIER